MSSINDREPNELSDSSNKSEESIPSTSGTPTVTFNKHPPNNDVELPTEIAILAEKTVGSSESQSTDVNKDQTHTTESTRVQLEGDRVPKVLSNIVCDTDVSMMSVDGNVTFNACERTFQKDADDQQDNPEDLKESKGNSESAEESGMNLTFSPISDRKSTDDQKVTPTKRQDPANDSDFEEFSTPTQDFANYYKESTANKNIKDSTFDKGQFTEMVNLNETFDRYGEDDGESSELSLRLEASTRVEESIAAPNRTTEVGETMKKPDVSKTTEVSLEPFPEETQKTEKLLENNSEQLPEGETPATAERDLSEKTVPLSPSVQKIEKPEEGNSTREETRDSKVEASSHSEEKKTENEAISEEGKEPLDESPTKDRKSSSFLKRRSSLLELSFVSSPKRLNANQTPKLTKGRHRSSLINFNESIAFDFTAAAKSAENNGGVAEMGSFVFSASSGLPVGEGDPFDLNLLEKLDRDNKQGSKENYTRVSFIAMFDPIEKEALKAEKPISKRSEAFKAPFSPLVKGLAVPSFSIRKSSVATQTTEERENSEDDENGVLVSADLLEKIRSEAAEMTEYLPAVQQKIVVLESLLAQNEKHLSAVQSADPEVVKKLEKRISEEIHKNEELVSYTRTMESSMKSMLKLTTDHRESNELLRSTVEQQQNALNDMNDTIHDMHAEREDLLSTLGEVRKERDHWTSVGRSNEKTITLLRLQLQAKESEVESLNQQAKISKNEVESLRKLVKTLNMP